MLVDNAWGLPDGRVEHGRIGGLAVPVVMEEDFHVRGATTQKAADEAVAIRRPVNQRGRDVFDERIEAPRGRLPFRAATPEIRRHALQIRRPMPVTHREGPRSIRTMNERFRSVWIASLRI